jgi:hypothetical protein
MPLVHTPILELTKIISLYKTLDQFEDKAFFILGTGEISIDKLESVHANGYETNNLYFYARNIHDNQLVHAYMEMSNHGGYIINDENSLSGIEIITVDTPEQAIYQVKRILEILINLKGI